MVKRGLFFVFEGIDGSGQDTQAELLRQRLEEKGYKIWLTGEPTDGTIGKEIRQVLRHQLPHPGAESLQLLMMEDRVIHVGDIENHLNKGEIVISIRYFYSTLAYGVADGLNYANLCWMNAGFPRPHITIYLDVKPEVAMARIAARGEPYELFEKQIFLTEVSRNFIQLLGDFGEFRLVDGNGDIEFVRQQVWDMVNPYLETFPAK